MDNRGSCISQPCSETLTENFSANALGEQEINTSSVLDCTSSRDQLHNVTMVENKDSVIMISGQVSTVVESQPTESESNNANVKMDIQSGNSSCHPTDAFGDSGSVNSNYYVLVEGSDGSQVISRVIPSILPGSSEESHLALNAVLQSDISYIDSSTLNEVKDQASYSESVTMIVDPSLQVQESQKMFIEPSLANLNNQNISEEQLSILEKSSEQPLDDGLPQKSIVVDNSLLSSHYQSVQVSSQKKDTSPGSPIRIIDVSNWNSNNKQIIERPQGLISVQSKEVEKQLKEEQRQMDLRLLEQSHREHQEKLQHRRNKDDDKDLQLKRDESDNVLKEFGIDDNTPIFSHVSAKINPDLLQHVPGCQSFLLSEAARKTTSAGVTFFSELDCSFSGEIKDFVSLHAMIKNLLNLLSPTNLIFDKCKERVKQENKNIGCNLLVPYVSSKGRLCKQSSKLMQMGGLLNMEECMSDTESNDSKDVLKRRKRGYRKRKVPLRNKAETGQEYGFVSNNYNSSEVENATSDQEHEGKLHQVLENISSFEGSSSNQFGDTINPEINDPIQRRPLDDKIKCEQICEENNVLKQIKTDVMIQRNNFPQIKEKALHSQPSSHDKTRRSTQGRPPKIFDPSETVCRVKPRNPLTESLETKQRRIYEENVSFKFFCDQCSFKTKRQSHFDHHLTYHEKGTDVKHFCRHCDFISISLPALKQHELLHKKNVLKCAICNVYITDKKHLMQKHIRLRHSAKAMATTEKMFTCSYCSATFTSRIFLSRHKTLHLKSETGQASESASTNVCTQCKKSFGKKIHLHRHMKDVHGPQNRPHLCDKCGRSFKRKDALQQHRIVHVAKSARVLPFKCNKCDKAFRSQAHLKEHSSIHSSDRPFLCQYCGASFKTQPVQKKHILTLHIQPRTHVCAVCCRQFNTKHALQRHESTHKAKEITAVDEGMRSWEPGVIVNDAIKKMEGKAENEALADNLIVSLEEDQTGTPLVVKTEDGAQVMVDPSLVPAMMGSSDRHSTSDGTRTLEVSQTLIQTGQTDQEFYYLTDEHI